MTSKPGRQDGDGLALTAAVARYPDPLDRFPEAIARRRQDFIEGFKAALAVAPPQPAHAAMREALIAEFSQFPNRNGAGRHVAIVDWFLARLSASVPSPDGAGEEQIRKNYAASAVFVCIALADEVACAKGNAQDVANSLRERFSSSPAGAAEPDDPKSVARVLLGWAKAYRDAPEHRFPSDPDAEFFPQDLEYAAELLSAAPLVKGDREAMVPPVERIECVKFDDNLLDVPADPVWRLEIGGICAPDFPTETWANNFRNAILSLPSAPVSGRDAVIEEPRNLLSRVQPIIEAAAKGYSVQIAACEILKDFRALSNHKESGTDSRSPKVNDDV